MSSEPAIDVRHLGKSYYIYGRPEDRLKQMILPKFDRLAGRPPRQYFRQFWALHDVSFSIGRGETVGIIGRNGSGKSTLLQLICGTVSPTLGSVTTRGRIAALLELGAGFNPEFTGRENARLNAAILGFSEHGIDERMEAIIAFSEIREFMDQPVKTYSSGMYARLAFSIAINVDPEILIVDEALAVGDARFVAKCMRRIRDIQEQGVSILFVSHDISSVRTLCERAIWLDKGRLAEDGDVFPVTGRYVEDMFKDDAPEASPKAKLVPDTGGGQVAVAVAGGPTATEVGDGHGLDARPVTHWGSHKGVIVAASVCDEQGVRRDVLAWGKPMTIFISVCVPRDIPRDSLSIAFSIKNLKGTDLIVSTTFDRERLRLPDEEAFQVRFSMDNALVSGKYLLVAAVENRRGKDIYYYEYFEGAHYFSSLAVERFFGAFQPFIQQSIEVV